MRSTSVRLVTSLLCAAVVATGFTAFATNPTRADVPASPAPSASTAAVKAGSVDIKDFAYVPPTITVAVGEKVTFKNTDTVAHTVTADDKSFDSGNMDQGATWSHIFDKAGTYSYVCAYHAFMHGTVVVK
jgi:plastocyanin